MDSGSESPKPELESIKERVAKFERDFFDNQKVRATGNLINRIDQMISFLESSSDLATKVAAAKLRGDGTMLWYDMKQGIQHILLGDSTISTSGSFIDPIIHSLAAGQFITRENFPQGYAFPYARTCMGFIEIRHPTSPQ